MPTNPTTTYAGVAHPSFAAYAAFEELAAVYGDDAFRRTPIIGGVHGPIELDEYNALPACICAGTGDHDGQSVECCDECRPDLF